MNYQETVEWMFQQLPMYQQVGKAAYKKDLSNITKLSAYLEEPHKAFRSIHVAGTNGKGSVSHMLASVLQEAGYKVGLYTSPHLKDFRERIRINGKMIPEQAVVDFIRTHGNFLKQEKLSFFEMTVGMAFNFFSWEEVDVAVIEVGLGGRLDSTNIITPELSVITNIGFDHTNILGETLSEIAGEKAGIIKENVPVVVGESHVETLPVFEQKAAERRAPIHLAEDFSEEILSTDLKGAYQRKNVRTVQTSVEVLNKLGWRISREVLEKGLLNVVPGTGLRGRWEIFKEHPRVICDTAHNKEGLAYTMQQLQQENAQDLHIVLGVVNDKDLDAVLPLFPKHAYYYFCRPDIPRGMEVEQLRRAAQMHNLFGHSFSGVTSAYEAALKKAKKEDTIYIGGSTFVVAEVL